MGDRVGEAGKEGGERAMEKESREESRRGCSNTNDTTRTGFTTWSFIEEQMFET